MLESVELENHDSKTVISLQLGCQEASIMEKEFMRTPSWFLKCKYTDEEEDEDPISKVSLQPLPLQMKRTSKEKPLNQPLRESDFHNASHRALQPAPRKEEIQRSISAQVSDRSARPSNTPTVAPQQASIMQTPTG